jgi:asparagine synthase (glutamine-hydrolysing)
MCGIAGFTGPFDQSTLRTMAHSVAHRGPDQEGFYYCSETGTHLAHRRLSILDIEGGAQPMWSADGKIGIVFNGEIYNHLDLRKFLVGKGHSFRSDHSDTESLIYAYREWGPEFVSKLNGMFAFCIFDRERQELFLARDRFGKKPLYVSQTHNGIVFASELKSLLCHPDIVQEIDAVNLQKYFAYGFIPAPGSLYKNIQKLPGGSGLIYDIKQKRSRSMTYWKFRTSVDPNYATASEMDIADELRTRLRTAVQRRLVADVPVGIFLSGGVDSATLLATACQTMDAAEIHTFSIGFTERQYDESWQAKKIAQYFGTKHSESILSVSAARDIADHVLAMLDEPMADSSLLPTYLLSRFARQSVKVALSGDGGDELFAGYAPFKALKPAHIYTRFVPLLARNMMRHLIERLPASEGYFSLDFKLKRTLQGLDYPESVWNPVWMSPLLPDEIAELTRQPVNFYDLYDDAIRVWNECESDDLVARSIEYYGQFYLQNDVLTKVDRASMMVGLEARAPFLDNEVVELASKLPSNLKFRHGKTKYILKKAMKGILPDDLLARPKKGFGIPLTSWLKSWPIDNFSASICDPGMVQKLLHEHRAGRRDNRLSLWAWIVLKAHLDALEKAAAPQRQTA